ncbi:MAG: MBL fold metallo-hydrolase [bacterium]|nr:MBL fold metallo-hydrolase [bacterium]
MKSHLAHALVALMIACLWSPLGMAQEDAPVAQVEASKLTDTIYELTCSFGYPVNVVASVGPDGVLLVDAGFSGTADAISKTLIGLGGGPIRFIVNTHIHDDHVGGNSQLGEAAAIIAHSNTSERLSGAYFSLPPIPTPGAPNLDVDGEVILRFNGERIRVFSPTGGHTDGDLVVHFTDSGVACLGDLLFSETFPFVHVARGGDAQRQIRTLQELAETLPSDTVVISGHGRHLSIEELRGYATILEETMGVVHQALAKGKSAEQIHEEGLLQPWVTWSGDDLTSSKSWIRWIADSLKWRQNDVKPSICEPLTETIMNTGVGAGVEQYRQLASTQSGEYDFGEYQLNMLGYQLLGREMTAEAIEVFKLNTEAFPESGNAHDSLAEAFMVHGDSKLAIMNYERSLELDPGNTNAEQKLVELKK